MKKHGGGEEEDGGLKGLCSRPGLPLDAGSWSVEEADPSALVRFARGSHPCDFTTQVNEQMAPKQQRTSWRCPLDPFSVRAIFLSRAWPINNVGPTFLYRLLLKARLGT